jgi:phosphoglycerol transferase
MLHFTLYFLGFVAACLARWVHGTFGEVTVEQILYHLFLVDGAAVHMSGIFAFEFGTEVIGVPLLLALLATLLHRAARRRCGGFGAVLLRIVPPVVLVAGAVVLLVRIPVAPLLLAWSQPDTFAAAYVDPAGVRLAPAERKRNLVLVYAESLEATFGDARLFGRDLLAPLAQVGGVSFADYRQGHGTGWTIAGMVATQCGVPLLVWSPLDVPRNAQDRAFLAGATCLGDVLQAHGYRNVFLGGAPLSFAGKGTFLRDHGYQQAWGREEWQQAGLARRDVNTWGLTDNALFAQARAQLDKLHAAGKPFNLTLLTLDMHGPSGFLSAACRERGARDYQGIVECSGHQLAEFAQYLRQRGYLKDTVLVIVGDHLVHGNPIGEPLERAPQRRLYSLVVSEPQPVLASSEMLPFDLLPTLLELVGVEVPGDRLGLGVSGIQAPGQARPARPAADLRALAASAGYRRLWQAPQP